LIVERLHERGIPADTSNYCGSNFCNQSYYTTLFFEEEHLRNRNIQQGYKIVVENPNHERYVSSLLGQSQPEFKTVFVHLPQYPDQTGGLGGREFSDQCKDVKALIDEIVKAESDEKITDRLLRCAKKSYNKHFRNF